MAAALVCGVWLPLSALGPDAGSEVPTVWERDCSQQEVPANRGGPGGGRSGGRSCRGMTWDTGTRAC